MSSMAVVILAAGGAKRFGSAKQLAMINGKAMLQHLVDTSRQLSPNSHYLVLGANRTEIESEIQIQADRVIQNSDWVEGLSSSIKAATEMLQQEYEGLLFVAGDQPYIQLEQLAQLEEKWLQSPEKICAAQYANTYGIPAVFPRRLYPQLLNLQGDRGAKTLIQDNIDAVQSVVIEEAAMDVDQMRDITDL